MPDEYQELRKLYYIDKDRYKAEYERRFNSDIAIKLNFSVGGNQAFFLQDTAVVSLMYSILRLDKNIEQLCAALPPAALRQYMIKCLIDEIVLSNNIEGVYSSRKEIGQVLTQLEEQSRKKGRDKRFEGLVNKYLKLLSGEDVSLKCCQDIRDLYDEIVLDEVVEEDKRNAPDGKIFRKEATTVRSSTDKVIHTGIAPESRIIEAMDSALDFLNDEDIEPMYRIAVFHYLFEYIHPFYDGNGRTGRFILSFCLSRTMSPIMSYRISEVLKENINEYYKAFSSCNDPKDLGDITPFLIMMLKMIELSAIDLKESLERKQISLQRYQSAVSGCYETGSDPEKLFYDLLIQASLFSELGIPAKELTETLGVSYVTLKTKYLDAARSKNLLIEKKNGNTKVYSINIDLLDEIIMN